MAVVGGEHLLHAGPSLGPFVADHHDVARLDLPGNDTVVRVFLALEDDRRSAMLVHLRADSGRLDDSTPRREVAAQHRQPASPGIGAGDRADHVPRVEF